MIKIEYNNNLENTAVGKHCFIYRGKEMEQIKKELGRESQELCLKVFYDQDKLGNWGDDPKDPTDKRNTTLEEATQIQNICWWFGFAPRVYKLMQVEWTGQAREGKTGVKKICDAQVVDYVEGQQGLTWEADKMADAITALGKEYGFKINYKEVIGRDLIDNKFLDFQIFNLEREYKEKIKQKYIEFGTYGKKYYHNVPELGLNGCPRENENRVKWLGLDKIDFKGKRVADLGCAGGWFLRYMASRGAKEIGGVDTKKDAMKDPLLASFLVNNMLGFYNIDSKEIDLNNTVTHGDFDIALFLSMTFHIKNIDWLNKVAKLVIVEDNSKNRDADKKLKQLFNKVEHKGFTEDREKSHLPIYYCYQ